MAHLPSCPEPPEPPLPPPRSINASPKSALLVENDESLLNFLRSSLKNDGYAVRTASSSEEGLRLYRDCAPFNVVLINYCVPPRDGVWIDCLAPLQTHGIGLAMAIREIHPSQGIIIAAFDYRDVPWPRELMHIPRLTDPCDSHLRSLLERIEVDRASEALTTTELLQLQLLGYVLVRRLGQAACGRTWEDLLGEARLRTLIGTRHWNKEVDFVMHLKGLCRAFLTAGSGSSSRRKST